MQKVLSDVDVWTLQDNVNWLDQQNVIKQMLRANLHQRQYAELVRLIWADAKPDAAITDTYVLIPWDHDMYAVIVTVVNTVHGQTQG